MNDDLQVPRVAPQVRHLVAVSSTGVIRSDGTHTIPAPSGPAGVRPDVRRRRPRVRTLGGGDEGFTLVELLVVVLMLVALVGIAVPTFVGQRDGAVRAAVQSELRTAAIALETFRAQQGVYGAGALTAAFGYVPSLEVASFLSIGSGGDSFCVLAWYDPDLDPADVTALLAGSSAEWAISPGGMEFVGDQTAPRACS